jgi:hypothetical protein
VNVKLFSSRFKVAFLAIAVMLSSLGIASPAHAKTYKCSKGGSFKVSKGYFDGDSFRNSGYVSEGKSCKGTAKIPATVTRIEAEAFYRNKKLTNVTFAKGSKLRTIGSTAFSDSGLTSITIPASVTTIDDGSLDDDYEDIGAFSHTPKLKSVTFAKGSKLRTIGSTAFSGSGLTSITIPASVTTIRDSAFQNTAKLKKITFAEGSKLRSIGGFTFFQSGITGITIPASVSIIGEYAFSVSELQTVVFSSSSKLKSIEESTFANSTLLKSINIPNGVARIEAGAFSGTSISSITIPASVIHFGSDYTYDGALGGMSKLKTVTFANESKVAFLPERLFLGNSALTSISIPDSVTRIGSGAFSGTGLTNVTIPRSVTILESGALSDMKKLKSVTFAEGSDVKGFYDSLFAGSSALNSLTIPGSVTTIAGNVFSGTALATINIPASVISVDQWTFSESSVSNINVSGSNPVYSSTSGVLFDKGKTELIAYPPKKSSIKYSVPDLVTKIGNGAFRSSANLRNITIPESVNSIGEGAFGYASRLNSVSFAGSSNLKTIEYQAFEGASALDSIMIPASVTSIGDFAFSRTNLESLEFEADSKLEGIGEYAFASTYMVNLSLPCSLKSIGDNAFGYNNYRLVSILIPCDLEYLGDEAFGATTALESLIFLGSKIEQVGQGVFNTLPNDATFYIKAAAQENFAPFGDGWEGLIIAEVPDSYRGTFDYETVEDETSETGYSVTIHGYSGGTSLVDFPEGFYIPESFEGNPVTRIGGGAFNGDWITSLKLPDSIKTIGRNAFHVNGLTRVDIPAGVTEIGYDAFRSNYLVSVTFKGDAPTDGGDVFYDNDRLTEIRVPTGATGWGSTFSGIPVVRY